MKKLFAIFFLLFVVACSRGQETMAQRPAGEVIRAPAAESMEAPVVEETTTAVETESVTNDVLVDIKGFAYSLVELKVKKGTTVTWTNQDSVRHNVAFDSGAVKGPLLAKGETYSYTFDEIGTFAYHCSPHPNMRARVIVE